MVYLIICRIVIKIRHVQTQTKLAHLHTEIRREISDVALNFSVYLHNRYITEKHAALNIDSFVRK